MRPGGVSHAPAVLIGSVRVVVLHRSSAPAQDDVPVVTSNCPQFYNPCSGRAPVSTTLELFNPRGYNFFMTNAARRLIDSFEALPEEEKHEVLGQLLRRLLEKPYAAPSDDELTGVADQVFQDYDRREAQG
jgi:hypothetical protein